MAKATVPTPAAFSAGAKRPTTTDAASTRTVLQGRGYKPNLRNATRTQRNGKTMPVGLR